ncbi:MAG: putative small secreted protein [Saprospiraceae bacterium]|jgi:predicted small secreted protein
MKHLRLLILFVAMTSFTACNLMSPCGNSKEEFLKNYNAFIKNIEEKDLAYDANEWEAYDSDFKQIIEECHEKYKAEMSASEEIDFWTNALAYYYYRYGTDMISVLRDSSNELSVTISENVNSAIDNPKVVLKKILGKDKMDELEDLLDSFGKDIGKWGKKLEKLFE